MSYDKRNFGIDACFEATDEIQRLYSNVRGVRNNNPLNIVRDHSLWLGELPDGYLPRDSKFVQFSAMHYGARAGLKLLSNYRRFYGIKTIERICERWCPVGDGSNSPSAYAARVSFCVGVRSTSELKSVEHYVKVASAMAFVETGCKYQLWIPIFEYTNNQFRIFDDAYFINN